MEMKSDRREKARIKAAVAPPEGEKPKPRQKAAPAAKKTAAKKTAAKKAT